MALQSDVVTVEVKIRDLKLEKTVEFSMVDKMTASTDSPASIEPVALPTNKIKSKHGRNSFVIIVALPSMDLQGSKPFASSWSRARMCRAG